MLEELVCPNCAAPLTFSAGGGESMQCPYCHTIVLRSTPGAGPSNDKAAPAVSKAKIGLGLAALIILLIGALIAIIFGIVGDHGNPTIPPDK